MSISKIIGAFLAILIGAILLHLGLDALATVIAIPALVIKIIWGVAAILAILVIAWALEITIPFFRWK